MSVPGVRKSGEGYEMDARGYVCPYPQIFARRALRELAPGEVLDMIVDNRASCDGVPAAVANDGNEVLEISEVGESTWRIRIRKGRAAQPRGDPRVRAAARLRSGSCAARAS